MHLVESPPHKDPHSTLGLGSGIFKQASNLMHLESLQLEIGSRTKFDHSRWCEKSISYKTLI